METYKEFCQRRLKDNCRPISELEWTTGMSSNEIVDFYMENTSL